MKKNTVDPIKDALNKGVQYGFIPHNLTIENRHELDVFPFNVMFAQRKGTANGKIISANSVYEPLLSTYRIDEKQGSMEYINSYSHGNHLLIIYDYVNHSYVGHKYIGEKLVGSGCGKDWKTFFINLTMLGLFNGEGCKFD